MRDKVDVTKNIIHNGEKQGELERQVTLFETSQTEFYPEKEHLDLPYKGLNPYTEADASIFFGRRKDIQNVVNNLLAWRLTIVYGKSGVGKSSILRAGVTHTLNEEARQNIADYDGVPKLAVVVFPSLEEGGFCWKDDPLAGLMKHIEAAITRNRWGIRSPEPGLSFVETLKRWTDALGGEVGDGELYIILDQFEEYFLYHADEKGEGTFFAEFPRAVNCSDLRVNFLISIREDSIADLDRFRSRIPNLFEHRLQIGYLDGQAAREAIEKPIEYYNQHHIEPIAIEPELIDAVLDEVQVGKVVFGESGIGGSNVKSKPPSEMQIETPYLQLVMERLWNEEVDQGSHLLRLETFTTLGRADQIVKDHLNHQMQLLTEEEGHIAAGIFQHLVTSSGAKYAYSVLDLSDDTGFDQIQLKQMLETLSSGTQRILRPVGPAKLDQPETQRYEIFHDALTPAILDWRGRYLEKQKIEKETAALLAEKQRVEVEKQQAKTKKRLGSALLVISGVALASLGVLWYQFQRTQVIAKLNLQGSQALVQWETSDQLATLQAAMQAGQTVKNRKLLQEAPTPALALQQILDRIHEQNQWQAFDRVASGFGRSPDGQWLAVGSVDGELSLWNFQQQQWTQPFPTQGGQIYTVDLSQAGERIATASEDGKVRVWSKDGQLRQTFSPQSTSQGSTWRFPISLSSDGQKLAIVSETSRIDIWEVKTGRRLMSRDVVKDNEELDRIFRVRFSPDGKQLAIASGGRIALWDLQNDRVNSSWLAHEDGIIFDLRFSPDGQRLATASSDATASLWNLEGWRLCIFKGHGSAVFSVAFNSDGTQLATGSSDGTARVWDLANKTRFREVEGTEWLKLGGHNSDIMAVSFRDDGQRLATVTRLATASLWKLQEKQLTSFNLPPDQRDAVRAFSQVIFSPDGQHLATASLDGNARLWDRNGIQLNLFPGEASFGNRIPRMFFSSDGQQLGTISGDGTARLWNLNGQMVSELFKGLASQWVVGLDLAPDRSRLVTTTAQGTLRIRDFKGHLLKELPAYQSQVGVADFSPDGRRLATASEDGTARLWDWQRGQSRELKGHQGRITMVRFSPDGQRLATASQDGTARLWDLQGNQIRSFEQGSSIMSVQFSSDGQKLATASWNGTARIWDLQGNQLAEYRGDAGLWDASFSPDRTKLAIVGWRGTGELWPIKNLDQLLQDGCTWMKDYLGTHPEAEQTRKICSN